MMEWPRHQHLHQEWQEPLEELGKVQKRAFDETKVHRAKGLEQRADNPPPADQRRMAWMFSANDRL